jgi:hypothetical protein
MKCGANDLNKKTQRSRVTENILDFSDVAPVWKEVLESKGETDFAIFSFVKGSETKLKLDSKGAGGFEAVDENLREGVVQFIVGRFCVTMAGTPIEKTALIFFCEEGSLQPARRALVTRQFHCLTEAVKAHVNITATKPEDLTQEAVLYKIREGKVPLGTAAAESKE